MIRGPIGNYRPGKKGAKGSKAKNQGGGNYRFGRERGCYWLKRLSGVNKIKCDLYNK